MRRKLQFMCREVSAIRESVRPINRDVVVRVIDRRLGFREIDRNVRLKRAFFSHPSNINGVACDSLLYVARRMTSG